MYLRQAILDPDFIWMIFTAWADSYDTAMIEEDFYVTSSTFQPVAKVLTWQLHSGQNQLLQTAIQRNKKSNIEEEK